MPLLALPSELHLHIASYLDPFSTLKLSQANAMFFYLVRTPESMRKILSTLELQKPELFKGDPDVVPCYGCLTACRPLDFDIDASEAFSAVASVVSSGDSIKSDSYDDHCSPDCYCGWDLAFCLGGGKQEERRCKTCEEKKDEAKNSE
jgi:hypothetical protein